MEALINGTTGVIPQSIKREEIEREVALEKFFVNTEYDANKLFIFKTILPFIEGDTVPVRVIQAMCYLLTNGNFTENSYSLYLKHKAVYFNLSMEEVDKPVYIKGIEKLPRTNDTLCYFLQSLKKDFGDFYISSVEELKDEYHIFLSNGITFYFRPQYYYQLSCDTRNGRVFILNFNYKDWRKDVEIY